MTTNRQFSLPLEALAELKTETSTPSSTPTPARRTSSSSAPRNRIHERASGVRATHRVLPAQQIQTGRAGDQDRGDPGLCGTPASPRSGPAPNEIMKELIGCDLGL